MPSSLQGLQPNAAVFAMLGGPWVFTRRITPDDAEVRGEASLVGADGRQLYVETGQLILRDGRSFAATRRFLYRFEADAVHIDFADGPDTGRPYVSLRFAPAEDGWAEAHASHLCRADLYAVSLRVRSPDEWTMTVAVTGPQKAYSAATRYTRPLAFQGPEHGLETVKHSATPPSEDPP